MPSDLTIQNALAARRQGSISLEALVRAVLHHPDWHVPGRNTPDGVFVAETPICAFSTLVVARAYERSRRVSFDGGLVSVDGLTLVREVLRQAVSLGIDPGTAHEAWINHRDLPPLAELSQVAAAETVRRASVLASSSAPAASAPAASQPVDDDKRMADLGALLGSPPTPSPPAAPVLAEVGSSFLPAPPRLALSLLPRLVRQDFPGLAEGILSRALVPPDDPTQPIVSPMACLATMTPEGFCFATAKTLGTHSLEEMMQEASTRFALSLGARVPFRRDGATVRWTDPRAADVMLSSRLLGSLHAAFGLSRIVVGVPTRGHLLACAASDSSALVALMGEVDSIYRSNAAGGLYEHLILVEDGRALGRMAVGFREPKAVVRSRPAAAPQAKELRARSVAECGLYLNLCDYPDSSRKESMRVDGDDVIVDYECTSPRSGKRTDFSFRIPKTALAATSGDGPMIYGSGTEASKIIGPGQFFELAEGFAKATAADVTKLGKQDALAGMRIIERAAACMDEVSKFIPSDTDDFDPMPESTFWTASGKRSYARQPGRFCRGRLGAIGGAYRKIADRFRAHVHEQGWLYG